MRCKGLHAGTRCIARVRRFARLSCSCWCWFAFPFWLAWYGQYFSSRCLMRLLPAVSSPLPKFLPFLRLSKVVCVCSAALPCLGFTEQPMLYFFFGSLCHRCQRGGVLFRGNGTQGRLEDCYARGPEGHRWCSRGQAGRHTDTPRFLDRQVRRKPYLSFLNWCLGLALSHTSQCNKS